MQADRPIGLRLVAQHDATMQAPVQNDLPRLLLMTVFAPGGKHGGGVCVERLLRAYPRDRLLWAHHGLHIDTTSQLADEWADVTTWPTYLLQRPNRFGLRWLRDFGDWTFHAPLMARRIADRAREHGAQAVLGVGPGASIWTSYLVAKRLGVPLHLWIHDDPIAHGQYRNYPQPLLQRIRRCFATAYRTAAVRYTISEPMRDHYRRVYGRDAVVLPPALGHGPLWIAPSSRRHDHLRIAIAGSIPGPDAWDAFQAALELLDDGQAVRRPIELTIYAEPQTVSLRPSLRLRGRVRVHVRGWLPADILDQELADVDYLYLPLWFDGSRRVHASTSFPTKFVTYLRYDKPILCHVPDYSSIAAFVRQYPVGPLLTTTDPKALAAQLRAAFDNESWPRCALAARAPAMAMFNSTTLLERLCEQVRRHHA